MKKIKLITLIIVLFGISSSAQAEIGLIQPDDFVGFSFWLISMSCLAATVFFFLEHSSVSQAWKVPITIASLITGITFIHSAYVGSIWISTNDAPIIYKYIDWLITMPLLAIQFYFVLSSARKVSVMIFWKLLLGAIIMVIGGYVGEAGYVLPFLGLIIWMAGWSYILYEIFSGDAGLFVSRSSNEDLVATFGAMRIIVTVGWTIYPLGYVFGYLTGGIDSNSLNVIYNFGDFVNKIAFGVVIWSAAKQH